MAEPFEIQLSKSPDFISPLCRTASRSHSCKCLAYRGCESFNQKFPTQLYLLLFSIGFKYLSKLQKIIKLCLCYIIHLVTFGFLVVVPLRNLCYLFDLKVIMASVIKGVNLSSSKALAELKKSFESLDILVCAKCLSVFHQIQDFR